jgi:acetate kinase
MTILVFNAGSNSLKFDVIDAQAGQPTPSAGRALASGAIDDIGKQATFTSGGRRTSVRAGSYREAAAHALEWIRTQPGLRVEAVAHRVVHGGDEFRTPAGIDDSVIAAIERWGEAAPLHNTSTLEVVRRVREAMDTPAVAVFDTAFHCSIPETAFTYALPFELSKELGIRRYGFHGISHQYQLLRYAELNGVSPRQVKLVTLHLEGGSSAAAIRDGHSVDTSMGFTPLEGLAMGSRCGDIDPAIVPYVARKRGMTLDAVEHMLDHESGLLGVSGVSNDTRILVQRIAEPRARLALEVFSYRVFKYVSAYLGVLGGADAIVFSGGIGENTPFVRSYVCERLRWCGLELDGGVNERAVEGDNRITRADSKLQAWAIRPDEARMIAHLAVDHLRKSGSHSDPDAASG